jgi:hypothetical protein
MLLEAMQCRIKIYNEACDGLQNANVDLLDRNVENIQRIGAVITTDLR